MTKKQKVENLWKQKGCPVGMFSCFIIAKTPVEGVTQSEVSTLLKEVIVDYCKEVTETRGTK